MRIFVEADPESPNVTVAQSPSVHPHFWGFQAAIMVEENGKRFQRFQSTGGVLDEKQEARLLAALREIEEVRASSIKSPESQASDASVTARTIDEAGTGREP